MAARIRSVIVALTLTLAGPASAQAVNAAAQLRADGVVGEQATGYMAPAPGVTLTAAQHRAMDQINTQRRALYMTKSEETGATAQQFAQFTACEIFKRLAPGESYRDENNVWRKVDAAGAVLPPWCAL